MTEPLPDNQYDIIEEWVINGFVRSAESKLRRLLKDQVIYDGKPTLFLSCLRSLGDGQCNVSIIKSIYLEGISCYHWAILNSSGLNDLNRITPTCA